MSTKKETTRQNIDKKLIAPTRLLSKNNDPNRKLTEYDFVLFPLNRLEWDTPYQVEVDYLVDQVKQKLVWQFKTRSLPQDPIVISQPNQEVFIKPNQREIIYLVTSPRNYETPSFYSKSENSFTIMPKLELIDFNTRWVHFDSPACSRMQYTAQNKRRQNLLTFYLNVAHPDAKLTVEDQRKKCNQYALKLIIDGLPGQLIEADGESLAVKVGQQYIFSVRPKSINEKLKGFNVSHNNRINLKFDQYQREPYSFIFRARGPVGAKGRVKFSNGRNFSFVIN